MFCIISAGTEPGHLITRPEITSYVEVGMRIFKLKKKEKPPSTKGLSPGEHEGNFTVGCHERGMPRAWDATGAGRPLVDSTLHAAHPELPPGCAPRPPQCCGTPGSAPAEPIPRGRQGAIGATLR